MTRAATLAADADLVDQLFNAAFNVKRDPRSAEYKAGVRAALNYRANRAAVEILYAPGTASADAWSAGIAEGKAIWNAYLESQRYLVLPFGGGD